MNIWKGEVTQTKRTKFILKPYLNSNDNELNWYNMENIHIKF